jgi:hypothetical protein
VRLLAKQAIARAIRATADQPTSINECIGLCDEGVLRDLRTISGAAVLLSLSPGDGLVRGGVLQPPVVLGPGVVTEEFWPRHVRQVQAFDWDQV